MFGQTPFGNGESPRTFDCPKCKATGSIRHDFIGKLPCDMCGGHGKTTERIVPCEKCYGALKIPNGPLGEISCDRCRRTGYHKAAASV